MLTWLDSATWGDLPANSLHVTAMRLGLAAVLGVPVGRASLNQEGRSSAARFWASVRRSAMERKGWMRCWANHSAKRLTLSTQMKTQRE